MRTTKKCFRLALLALCLAALFASVTALAAESYMWPVPASNRVTQAYKGSSHTGIDIGGSTGDTIVAHQIRHGAVCVYGLRQQERGGLGQQGLRGGGLLAQLRQVYQKRQEDLQLGLWQRRCPPACGRQRLFDVCAHEYGQRPQGRHCFAGRPSSARWAARAIRPARTCILS